MAKLYRSICRVHRAARLLPALCLLLCAAATSPVHGDDTNRRFAAPIDTPQLVVYMERLGTSTDQQWAIMRMYESYRAAYRRLREEVLEPASDRLDRLDQGSALPDPTEAERAVRAVEAAAERIAHLDARLFDEMQEVLSREQARRLARVRMARERVRHRSGSFDMLVAEQLEGLDLDDLLRRKGHGTHGLQSEALDDMLLSYEQHLTAELGRLARMGNEFMLGVVDAIRASGIAPGAEREDQPQAIAALRGAIMALRQEVEVRRQRIVLALRSTALSTAQRIAMSMDSPEGEGFVRAAIGELVGGDQGWQLTAHGSHQDFLWSVQRMVADMEAADAAALEEALERIVPQVDQRAGHVFELDQQRRAVQRPSEDERDQYQELSRQINVRMGEVAALYAELADIMSAHDRAVQSAVKWSDRMRAIGAQPGEAAPLAAQRPEAGAPARPAPPNADDPEAHSWTGDWSVPPPIGRSDLRDLQMLLALDEAECAEVERLFEAYRASYRSLESAEQVRRLARRRWSADTQSGAPRLDEDGLRTLRKERRRALQDVIEAGDRFLESVDRAVSAPQRTEMIEVFRSAHHARCRARYVHLWIQTNTMDQEWMVDPLQLIVRLPNAQSDEVRRALLAAAGMLQQLASAAQPAFDAALDNQFEQERWQVLSSVAAASGDTIDEDYEQVRRRLYDQSMPLRMARGEMAGYVRASVAFMCETLPPELARQLQSELIRSAFPTTFAAGLDVDGFTRAALTLPDLSVHQREHVKEMLATFRPAFDAHTDQMVEIIRSASFEIMPADGAHEDASQMQRAFDRLIDDRRHLVHRWLFEFRSVLTDAQIRAITSTTGPLPDLGSF